MILNKKIYAIIPARGGSKRLKRKNIHLINGKPMIEWAISACKNSKFIDKCFVSSEDREILDIAINAKVETILRPLHLSEDHVYKQDAIVHATSEILEKNLNPSIIISLQANSPEISEVDLDSAIEKFIKFDRNEMFSVDKNLIQNAAFRIMKVNYVFQKTLSTKCGVYITDYMDIHTIDDVKSVEKRMSKKNVP